jgi:hypothetical protein
MEDLTVEELKQLINFYRQRSSDLEFSLLQSQLKLTKAISFLQTEGPKPAIKTTIDKKM